MNRLLTMTKSLPQMISKNNLCKWFFAEAFFVFSIRENSIAIYIHSTYYVLPTRKVWYLSSCFRDFNKIYSGIIPVEKIIGTGIVQEFWPEFWLKEHMASTVIYLLSIQNCLHGFIYCHLFSKLSTIKR